MRLTSIPASSSTLRARDAVSNQASSSAPAECPPYSSSALSSSTTSSTEAEAQDFASATASARVSAVSAEGWIWKRRWYRAGTGGLLI
ncbi:hypothetical protein GXW82_42980 [Streptacidiphilus sp. 4-A2]|nr:hypothetical protein [Streptacidiphilus sp. 4-A2]